MQEFPVCPVVRTWCFRCRWPGFNPWLGNEDPASYMAWQKKKGGGGRGLEEKKKSLAEAIFISIVLPSKTLERSWNQEALTMRKESQSEDTQGGREWVPGKPREQRISRSVHTAKKSGGVRSEKSPLMWP